MKYYCCDICGNMFEVIDDFEVVPMCCGTEMRILTPNKDDTGSLEKHVPVYTKDGFVVRVKVGETSHPMAPEHYVEWIELETNKGTYRKYLQPFDEPEAVFVLDKDEEIVNIFEHCNIHGLWVNNETK